MANMPLEERRKFHINRGINLDTILTIVAMAGGFFLWSMSQERRTTAIESAIKAQADINVKQDEDAKAINARLEAWMVRVEAKVDRAIGSR